MADARALNTPNLSLPEKVSKNRLPIFLGLALAIGVGGFLFVFSLLQQEKQEEAWNSFLNQGGLEDAKAVSALEASVRGSSAEPWVLLAVASKALEDENFAEAEKALDRLDQLPSSPNHLTRLFFPGESQQKLGKALLAKIQKYKEWKGAHSLLFQNPEPDAKPRITLVTDQGEFVIALYSKMAPKTCENFIKLCKEKSYDNTAFSDIQVGASIRGGDLTSKSDDASQWANTGPGYSLDIEKNDLSHFKGAVSMYRAKGENSAAGSQFVISARNQFDQDSELPIFGQIVSGMDIIEKIAAISSTMQANKMVPNQIVRIKETRVEE